ncbi:MAG: hypothetical protein DME19_03800 [Verrucomicrobia bacterium]|nr:MAG: hypothetical protein DME19_03800 [Verrucomicrobiota bacterium]
MLLGMVLLFPVQKSVAVTFPLRWRWSNPLPHGNNTVDMAYSATLGLGVQVTERGQLYTSDNLSTWLPRDSRVTNALRAVTFFGPRIVITGESGMVLYADSVTDFRLGTLLDGPTDDWLEAVAASSQTLVAVGDNGAVYTSTNGVSWKRQASLNQWLRGVAFGNGTFVAVGENGLIATSPDGTNWTGSASGTTPNLNRVAFSGSFFTTVGEGGVTLTSTNNGLSWFSEQTGATNDLFNASNGDGTRLAIGENEVRLQNSFGWSNQLAQANGPPSWTYYANIGRQDFFLIAGRTGMMAEGYSTNDSSYYWLPSTDSIRQWLFDVTWATNLYVAVGDRATVMTSGNGIDWSLELVPDSVTNSIFLGVGGTTNLLVAAGNQGSLIISPYAETNVMLTNVVGTNVVVTNQVISKLGVDWYDVQPRPTTNDLQGVGLFGDLYLVTGDNGTVLTSPDGTNWTRRVTPTSALLSSVAASPDIVVATGDNGTIITSRDGANWALQNSRTANWIYRVRYLAGEFIAVGQNGTLMTSADGTNWNPQVSGTTRWLNDVTRIDGTLFAVGTQGTVLTSTNAVDWISRGTITAKSLYAAATDSDQLIAVGIEGIILRSQIVPDLTPVSILSYSRFESTQSSTVNNLFLFGGKADQRFTLDSRLGFETNVWSRGPLLEFYDSSGTFYYLESLPDSNAPPRQFYHGTLTP